MKDLNRHECIGRIGQDPDIKYTQSGKCVAVISVACGNTWKDKETGQKQENTEWIRYVAYEKLAEIMAQYLKKGSKIYITGAMRTRKWQDKNGQDSYTTEIVANEMQMLDSKPDGNLTVMHPSNQQPQMQQPLVMQSNHMPSHTQQPNMQNYQQGTSEFFDDDIPF